MIAYRPPPPGSPPPSHVHAYERSCRVYKGKCDPSGYYAITIG